MPETAPNLFDTPDRESRAFVVAQDNAAARANPVIKHVHDYWLSIGGGRIPYRSAFDFMDIYKAAPNLILLHRFADHCFRYIFFGTALVELFDYDFTGDEITPDRRNRPRKVDWSQVYTNVLDKGSLIFEQREIKDFPTKEIFTIVSFKAPLADDDGRPAFLLNCLVPIDRQRQNLF